MPQVREVAPKPLLTRTIRSPTLKELVHTFVFDCDRVRRISSSLFNTLVSSIGWLWNTFIRRLARQKPVRQAVTRKLGALRRSEM
ncbi:unnamed protein product [Ixodes pacificus]